MIKRRTPGPIFFTFLLVTFLSVAAYGQEAIKISHGPYLQSMTDSSVTIVWTTNKPAIAWVEIAPDDGSHFYNQERPKFFNTIDGLKKIGKIHQVTLHNLRPATLYRYRVYSREVVNHERNTIYYGRTAATAIFKSRPLGFTTGGKSGPFEFSVVNDIHERSDFLKKLLGQLDFKKMDFVVFNGDMISNAISEQQVFQGFMDTAISIFAKETPMYYARGNHETRGPFASEFSSYFPTNNGHLYYSFTRGNTRFIVLDGGEDKPDSDIEYSEITDMDAYRTQQAEWLKKEVETPAFKKARFKIVICHIPPVNGWHGGRDIIQKFVPVLNTAGIHLWIAGHEHRHRISPANEITHFPVIVNSNTNLLKASITDTKGRFLITDSLSKKVDALTIH